MKHMKNCHSKEHDEWQQKQLEAERKQAITVASHRVSPGSLTEAFERGRHYPENLSIGNIFNHLKSKQDILSNSWGAEYCTVSCIRKSIREVALCRKSCLHVYSMSLISISIALCKTWSFMERNLTISLILMRYNRCLDIYCYSRVFQICRGENAQMKVKKKHC